MLTTYLIVSNLLMLYYETCTMSEASKKTINGHVVSFAIAFSWPILVLLLMFGVIIVELPKWIINK
jgi:hypothetical protein